MKGNSTFPETETMEPFPVGTSVISAGSFSNIQDYISNRRKNANPDRSIKEKKVLDDIKFTLFFILVVVFYDNEYFDQWK